jgi:hypothetical protein
MGFVQVGLKEKTSAFVLLSSVVQPEGFLSANEQIINFFILYSADGFGKRNTEFPHLHKALSVIDHLR